MRIAEASTSLRNPLQYMKTINIADSVYRLLTTLMQWYIHTVQCLPIPPSLPWQGCQRWPAMAPGSKGQSGHYSLLPSSASPGLSPPWTLNIVTQTRDTPPDTPTTFWYSVVALKDSNFINLIIFIQCSIPSRHKSAVSVFWAQWWGPEAAALPKVTIVKSLYFDTLKKSKM